MELPLSNQPWHGVAAAPPSKSVAHRLLIAATLAGASPAAAVALPGTPSQDLLATRRCLEALLSPQPVAECDCGESGSTLRFLLPVAAALGRRARFIGHGRLPQRPLDTLVELLSAHGVSCSGARLPLEIAGRLAPGDYALPGDISSQYLTGLLLALPLLDSPSRIRLTTALESAGYIDITLDVLRQFGVAIDCADGEYRVPAPQRHRLPSPPPLPVEGDWSNAAFLLAAGALAGPGLAVTGLRPDSAQGDRAVASILRRFGADLAWQPDDTLVARPAPLAALEIDARPIPDLVPALAIVATAAKGATRFVHAARLRLKESDRLETTCRLIRALGGHAETTPDTLVVIGTPLAGGRVDAAGDHRIAMAAAVAALRCAAPVVIDGAECAAKSWPDFWAATAALR